MQFLLRSHRLGRILGIEVNIAYSLYLVIGLFFLSNINQNQVYAVALLALPVFVLLHEFGHSLTARIFGVRVHGITLHALGGVAQLTGRLPNARAELIIAAVGPLVSFALSGIFFALFFVLLQFFAPPIFLPPPFLYSLIYFWAWQNLVLGLFNLLPIFPLDGGRIALSIAVMILGIHRGLRLVRPMSIIGAGFFVAWGVWEMIHGGNGIFLILIAGIVYFQGGQEMQARQYAAQYGHYDHW